MIRILPLRSWPQDCITWLFWALCVSGFLACEPAENVWPFESARMSEAELGVLEWFLTCEECTEADLERAVALGRQVVPFAEFTMTDFPPGARRNLTLRYGRIWDELHPDGIPRQEFIDHYLKGYLETLRTRSIILLDSLGSDSLRWALGRADSLDYGPESRAVLQAAVFRGGASDPGTLPPAADSGRISGRLTDGSGTGLAGVSVMARRCLRAPAAYSPPREERCLMYDSPPVGVSVMTDSAGHFLITGLREGVWEVAPVPPGATPQSLLVLLIGSADSEVADFSALP